VRDETARWNQDKELRKRLAALEAEVAELAGVEAGFVKG
jgi:hypothetical protein